MEVFANQPSTTVSSGGTTAPAGGTVETWTVASSSSFPAASNTATPATQFHVIDAAGSKTSEIIAVTNVSGSTWTVTRGAESTAPIAHTAGFTVTQIVTAGTLGAFPQGRSGIALVVAASNAAAGVKAGADYVCTGTADQATINTAIGALPGGGGLVLLSAGTFNITAPVTISSSNITLEGTGVSTKLGVVAGTNITSVVQVTGTGTVEVKLRKFFVQGQFGDTFGDGISINTPWQTTDSQHTLEDLYITNCPNNGIHVPANADTRVLLFNRIHVKNCKGNGFLFQFPSQTDSVFTDCIADTIGLNGFFCGGANNWFQNCKTFYCGSTGAGNYGFYITGYNNFFDSCQAQDNYYDGFFGDNTGDQTYGSFGCTFVNCSGDANGQNAIASGLRGRGTQNWQVIGGVWMNRPYPPAWSQKYGITWEDATTAATALRPSTGNVVTGAFFRSNATAAVNSTGTGPNYNLGNNYASAPSNLPGKLTVSSLAVTTSPVSGYVLTADNSGNALWAAPTGSGGVNTVDWISAVNSYGADNTGVADATTAINNALAAASSGTVVYLATGTYKVTAPLVIPQGVTLMGASGGFAIPIGNYGIAGLPVTGAIIKPAASFAGAAIITMTATAGVQGGQQQIRQLSIDCSSMTSVSTIHGIQATNAIAGIKLRDVLVYGGNGALKGNGLDARNVGGGGNTPDFWDISHCKFSGCAGNGVNLNGTSDCFVVACESTGNTGIGWNLTNGNNTRFIGCKAEGSTAGKGWQVTANSGFTGQLSFSNCTSSSNFSDGWYFTGTGAGVWSLANCRSNNDGTSNGSGMTVTGSFAGALQLTGFATVPGGSTTPATGLTISSAGAGCYILADNCLFWGRTTAVSNDGSAGAYLVSPTTVYRTGALTAPTSALQPLAVTLGGTGSTARNFAGLLTPTAVQATGYTAAAGDFVPCDTTSGSFTVTLPTAPADLTVVAVKQVIRGGTNTVTIATGGSDVFNVASGATSATLTLTAQAMIVQYKSSSAIWYVLADDLPLSQLDSRYVAQSSLPLAIGSGGTGQATQQAALDALAGAQTSGQFLRGGGTHVTLSAIQAGDVPTLNQNTTGTAAGLSATLAIGSGGTGQVSKAAAFDALQPMTTSGDIVYGGASGTGTRLAGDTSNTKKFLTGTASGGVAQAPAWAVVAAADLPAGTTSTQGALQLDGTAANILPDGVRAAGANGKPADSGHVHQNNAQLSLFLAPSGATAETYSRAGCATTANFTLASGTLALRAIPLPNGLAINNITFVTGSGTVEASGTHAWFCLLDSGYVVRAVSSDQTGAAYLGSTLTFFTLSVAASAYTTTYAGLYYVGICVVAGTMPAMYCTATPASAIWSAAPVIAGTSSTSQTTPPGTGTTMTTISQNAAANLYAYTS